MISFKTQEIYFDDVIMENPGDGCVEHSETLEVWNAEGIIWAETSSFYRNSVHGTTESYYLPNFELGKWEEIKKEYTQDACWEWFNKYFIECDWFSYSLIEKMITWKRFISHWKEWDLTNKNVYDVWLKELNSLKKWLPLHEYHLTYRESGDDYNLMFTENEEWFTLAEVDLQS